MTNPMEYLAQNAYVAIFMSVFVEQAGLPLPSAPALLAAGALAAAGRINFGVALCVSLVASLLADSLWYALGRRYGRRVLTFLCRISIQPDHCVRSTQEGFARHGAGLLVLAKFIPGLNTVASPLAGVVGMALRRFLFFDSMGILALSLVLTSAGYSLRGPLGRLARWLAGVGGWAALPLAVALLAYLGWRYARRWRALHELRIARVTPVDLKAKLDAGNPVVIIDLRHSLEMEGASPTLPGAIRMQPRELETRHAEIPRDRDIVLFCT